MYLLGEWYADADFHSHPEHGNLHVVVEFNEAIERLEIEIANLDWRTPAEFHQTLEQAIEQALHSRCPSLEIEVRPSWRVDTGF
jgi:hypothetical protein